jgi:hypothetical protein
MASMLRKPSRPHEASMLQDIRNLTDGLDNKRFLIDQDEALWSQDPI